jgi:ATP-dependent Clp protease ATP-binding subunit ClpX
MKPRYLYCSFCRRSSSDVGPLAEGPDEVCICGECIELCQSLLDRERRRRNPPREPVGSALLRETLDQLVGGQDEAKQALVLAAASRAEGRGRVLLLGSSGSAKILLARALAHATGAPFAAGDSRALVRSKVGPVEGLPLLYRLLEASDFDVEAAQRGVVFVEGAERQDVQDALLRLWQDETWHPIGELQLPVQGILFVCGGSFVGLDEAIVRLGLRAGQPVRAEELTAVGVRPDWAGCLAGIARVPPLDEESLVRVVQWVDFRLCDGEPAGPDAAADRPRD